MAQPNVNPRHPVPDAISRAPRLLYVVSEDWYFLSHRLPMARAARDAGFEVHVATRVKDGAAAIKNERFILHPIPFARGRLSPFASLSTILTLRSVHRAVDPDIVHHVSLQPSVLGLIAALGRPVTCINALTGFGYSFASKSLKARGVRWIMGPALRLLLNRNRITSLVQNIDDRADLMALGIAPSRIALIPGSGVDVTRLRPLAEPLGPLTFAFAGRLLQDKGIRTLIGAYRLLRAQRADVQLLIAGTPDPANPAAVTDAEATSWNNESGITWLGHVDNISDLWARAHIAVLPSRREGLPLSLLEAAACQRAMIASDVPGCREIVIHEETGLLCRVDDSAALAQAMASLASTPDRRVQYALAARKLIIDKFTAPIIGRQTLQLYRQLLDAQAKSNFLLDTADQIL